MDELILSIDFGTQSIRAMLFDPKGNMIAKSKQNIIPYYSNKPAWAEQSVHYLWENFCNATKKLFEKNKKLSSKIIGVCITTQRSTIINLDKDGNPLRPAIMWMDDRKTWNLKKYSKPERLLWKLVNVAVVVDIAQADCEANWIKRYQPEIWEKTHKYLYLSGFLMYKLCGEYKDSYGSQIGYMPFDFKRFKWCDGKDFKNFIFPIERDKLPDLVEPTNIIGYITNKASAETGIPQGLPIIATGSDKSCETIGIGCLEPDKVALSLGTAATVETTTNKYTEVIPFNPPYPSAIPNTWNTDFQIYRGFWMIEWFKKEFGDNEVKKALKNKVIPEDLLNEMLNEIEAGSMGLVLQPYWTTGINLPGPEGKGTIIGFGDIHTRSHLYKAIIEGLGYALREGADMTEKASKVKHKFVRLSGGASQSDAICQIIADIFNKPIQKSEIYEATGLGNAMVGMVGMKIHSDFSSAVNEMVKLSEPFHPKKEHSKIYNELYHKVYLKLYKKIKPLLKEIKNIVNYPYYGEDL